MKSNISVFNDVKFKNQVITGFLNACILYTALVYLLAKDKLTEYFLSTFDVGKVRMFRGIIKNQNFSAMKIHF